jgi:hypothetical protein
MDRISCDEMEKGIFIADSDKKRIDLLKEENRLIHHDSMTDNIITLNKGMRCKWHCENNGGGENQLAPTREIAVKYTLFSQKKHNLITINHPDYNERCHPR